MLMLFVEGVCTLYEMCCSYVAHYMYGDYHQNNQDL